MVKIHSKTNILKFLLSNKKEEYTIRAIAKNTHIDYKTVYLIVKELIKEKVILAKKAGQTVLCSINQKEFNANIFRAELTRKKELLKNKDFYVLYNYFENIKEPFFILLLFGSYVKNNQHKKSDIDLMLITDDEKIEKEIENKISLIPLDIHLLSFKSQEFISMLKTTDFNNNIILFGIEDYYRIIKKC